MKKLIAILALSLGTSLFAQTHVTDTDSLSSNCGPNDTHFNQGFTGLVGTARIDSLINKTACDLDLGNGTRKTIALKVGKGYSERLDIQSIRFNEKDFGLGRTTAGDIALVSIKGKEVILIASLCHRYYLNDAKAFGVNLGKEVRDTKEDLIIDTSRLEEKGIADIVGGAVELIYSNSESLVLYPWPIID